MTKEIRICLFVQYFVNCPYSHAITKVTYPYKAAVYEQDSEPAMVADKLTRLLSEAEPPLKPMQDQEVRKKMCHSYIRLYTIK